MRICVAGWYFGEETDDTVALYDVLTKTHKKHPVFIVAHRKLNERFVSLPYKQIPNFGLEFGCYDWFLKNEWDFASDVLFMHDDERIAGVEVFEKIASLKDEGVDQAFVFEDEAEGRANGRQHGRGIYCSQRFLLFLLAYKCDCKQTNDHEDDHNPGFIIPGTGIHTGFWHDPHNSNHSSGKPPPSIHHYNTAVSHFSYSATQAGRKGMKTRHQAYVEGFVSGRRGRYGCYEVARKKFEEEKRGDN